MGYYDGNFKIFYDDLSNTVHKIIQSRISLEKELGKTLDTFYPTYKYETYSIMPYSLDSVYHEDSLRLQKINEIYLPQYDTYQSILKKSNEIPQFFPQININIFDKNYIESKPNSQELYSALMEILNYNNEKLKLDSISITSKEEIISNINLVLNKTLSLLTENNKKIKSALKKGKTVEEKQNILISF